MDTHPHITDEVYYIDNLSIKSGKVFMIKAGSDAVQTTEFCTLILANGKSLIYDPDNSPRVSTAFLTKQDAKAFLQEQIDSM